MRYSMIFALSPSLDCLVFLRKPSDHKNPIFRDRWTVPGGKIEDGESDADGATRELLEETQISVNSNDLIPVLKFLCNCDPTESEHEVVIYGVTVPMEILRTARGDPKEPVAIFLDIPDKSLWYIEPLLALVKARMRQPR